MGVVKNSAGACSLVPLNGFKGLLIESPWHTNLSTPVLAGD